MRFIKDFCSHVGISRVLRYALRNERGGARETQIRSWGFVSRENAAEWLEAREVPAGTKAA